MSDLFEIKRNPNIIEIPDNATNGDMIKALFPNGKTYKLQDTVFCEIVENSCLGFDNNWWNAPYKENKE